MSSPPATVVITTKNRCDDLCRAIESVMSQSVDCEVLVIDDGSTDGTAEILARRFPSVQCVRHESSAGYIVRRNEGAALATAPIIVSIDDDAAFSSRLTIEQVLGAFANPRVGAAAIPYIDIRRSPAVQQQAPPGGPFVTSAFIGTAHAVRTDLFRRLGGYRSILFHFGEESDYCLRMLASGYVCLMVDADPIHHFESPTRDLRKMNIFGRRNDVLFAALNVPTPQVAVHLAATTLNGLRHGWRHGTLGVSIQGLARGYSDAAKSLRNRRPVPRAVYKLFRKLKRSGPLPLSQVESQLAPITATVNGIA
jgi:glycosyltransferase involved in cell wall biosynthesis